MNFKNYCKRFFAILGVLSIGILPARAQVQGTNIALGKTVTFSDKPNYSYSTDSKDHLQLTDGKHVSDGELRRIEGTTSMWVQKEAVGWQNRNPVTITIDLGKIYPISGASFSTAANLKNVNYPITIAVATSDDKKSWYSAGDLIPLSGEEGIPPMEGYSNFRFMTKRFQTYGRYIAFTVVGVPPVIITDEIEVYAGKPEWLNESRGNIIKGDLKEHAVQSATLAGVKRRLRLDSAKIQSMIADASIMDKQKERLQRQLDAQKIPVDNIDSVPDNFRTIVPLNDTHRKILSVYGELLSLQGERPLTVWKQHRYAPLSLLSKPIPAEKTELNFSMLRNQFRSDALILTNAGTESRTVNLMLSDPPKAAQPGWIRIDTAQWTDTQNGTVVAAALIPVNKENGIYSVTIPAGFSQKLWITVDSSKVQAGKTKSTLAVKDNTTEIHIPVTFDFSHIIMGKPRLSLTMWDYTNNGGSYGVTPKNRAAAIELMRSHFLDSPWGSHRVLPFPQAEDFDSENNLIKELDFTSFDEWVALWPNAKRYFIYRNLWGSKTFAGAQIETEEFKEKVGSWARAVANHIKESGLEPEKFYLQFVDEPHNDDQDAVAAAWSSAVNAAAPELKQFSNPMWQRPDQAKRQDAVSLMDALCPLLHKYLQGEEPVQQHYAELQSKGKDLWFYATRGPLRSLDPQMYYRYQAWHTFAVKGQGHGFWSFGSIGRATSSWNEYSATGIVYSPVYFDDNTVHSSIYWEALRESIEDYEELSMLRDAIEDTHDPTLKLEAQQLLDSAVQTITNTWKNDSSIYTWSSAQYDPGLADDQLQKVREMLEKLEM